MRYTMLHGMYLNMSANQAPRKKPEEKKKKDVLRRSRADSKYLKKDTVFRKLRSTECFFCFFFLRLSLFSVSHVYQPSSYSSRYKFAFCLVITEGRFASCRVLPAVEVPERKTLQRKQANDGRGQQ